MLAPCEPKYYRRPIYFEALVISIFYILVFSMIFILLMFEPCHTLDRFHQPKSNLRDFKSFQNQFVSKEIFLNTFSSRESDQIILGVIISKQAFTEKIPFERFNILENSFAPPKKFPPPLSLSVDSRFQMKINFFSFTGSHATVKCGPSLVPIHRNPNSNDRDHLVGDKLGSDAADLPVKCRIGKSHLLKFALDPKKLPARGF